MSRVAWITIAPVKGLALVSRAEVELTERGAAGDRRLYLVDETGRLANGKRFGSLVAVVPDLDEERGRLRLRLPAGHDVEGPIEPGEPVTTDFYGRPVAGRVVEGPFAAALSEVAEKPVRLVVPDRVGDALDRGSAAGAVTMLGTASLERLAGEVRARDVDPRRFRMLLGVEGLAAHAEDAWIGSRVSVGQAVVELLGNVGRCVVTTKNPDTGVPDLPTLTALAGYRGVMETTEPLPFGVVGRVVSPGLVRVGDDVRLAS